MNLRFIDAGTVSGLRSQTIYHGLGYAQTPETPDTIVLATPGTPYMCIGFFQDLENELDINYCRTKGLPESDVKLVAGLFILIKDSCLFNGYFNKVHSQDEWTNGFNSL